MRSGCDCITAVEVWITVRGLRSSWEASAVNWRNRSKLASTGCMTMRISSQLPPPANTRATIPPSQNPWRSC